MHSISVPALPAMSQACGHVVLNKASCRNHQAVCRDLRKALFGRYKRKERVEDDRRDDRGRGGPRPGGRDDFRDRRWDRSPDRRGRLVMICTALQ